MLNDANMLAIGSLGTTDFYFQEDAQTFYVSADNIGESYQYPYQATMVPYGAFWDGEQYLDETVYDSNYIGFPEWGIKHLTSQYTVPGNAACLSQDRISREANYRGVNAYSWQGMTLTAHILGLTDEWNHDAFFDYVDRWMVLTAIGGDWSASYRSLDAFAEDMWDAYRSNYGTVWPDESPVDDANNTDPVLTEIGTKTINENRTLSFTVVGTDADEGQTESLVFSLLYNPTDATINSATGAFTWKPTYQQSGIYYITFRVADPCEAMDIESVAITVSNKLQYLLTR